MLIFGNDFIGAVLKDPDSSNVPRRLAMIGLPLIAAVTAWLVWVALQHGML